MKAITIIFSLFFSLSLWAQDSVEVEFKQSLATELLGHGDVLDVQCLQEHPEQYSCSAKISLFELAEGQTGLGGAEEICTERYSYRPLNQTKTLLCSSCEYSKTYGYFDKDCL